MERNFDKMLSAVVEQIERAETTRERFGKVLRQIKGKIDLRRFPAVAANVIDTQFSTKVQPVSLSGLKMAGIDGGLIRRGFRSMDLILTRGVAVIFKFGAKEGPVVDFFPDPFPSPVVKPIMLSLSGQELDQLASLERVAAELRVTLSVLDEFSTDLILIDGSLFYHPRDRPPATSLVSDKFQEVMALYRQVYNKAKEKGTTLVGVVKDSRSTRIVNIMGEILPHIVRDPSVFEMMQGVDYRWLLKISRDCDLLDTFLDEGERTFVFRFSSEMQPNLSAYPDELASWAPLIWVTYVKTAQDDLPLRIEVLVGEGDNDVRLLDRALSAILPVSWQHKEYGIPTPIVEADARARISHNESQIIIDRLMALSGLTYTALEKRRSRNPFGG